MQLALREWAAAGVLLLILGGCVSSTGSPGEMSEAKVQALVRVVLQDFEDIYYKETRASELVAAGLYEVEARYPDVTFTRDKGAIVASVDGKTVDRFDAGQDKGDAVFWSDRVAAALASVEHAYPANQGVTLAALTDRFLNGLSHSADDATDYVSPAEVNFHTKESKDTGTLNLILLPDGIEWRVRRVYGFDKHNKNQLREGDRVLSIDGTSVRGLSEDALLSLYRGPVGSTAALEIERKGEAAPLTVTLRREDRKAVGIGIHPEGRVLRIAISVLDRPTLDVLRDTLSAQASSRGSIYDGIVLDLRNSPGGEIETSINIADIFLSDGPIFSTRGRHADAARKFTARKNAPTNPLPLVVLVDRNTGSGAEFAVVGLQDQGRAVVVGETTFGAGRIQTGLPLPNRGYLKLSWVQVIAPSGYHLDQRGVMPTVCTGGDVTAAAVLATLRAGGGVVDYATRSRDIDPEDSAAVAAFRALCPPRSDGDEDVGLEVSKALLEEPGLYEKVLAESNAE